MLQTNANPRAQDKEDNILNNTEMNTDVAASYEFRTISIVDMFKIGIKNWWMIVVVGIICAILFYAYSKATSVPVYMSQGTLYVDTQRDHINDNVDAGAILNAQDLIPTYIEILQSRTFNTVLSDEIGNKYLSDEIGEMISFKQVDATNILTVSAVSYDKDDSYIICKSVLNNASDAILRVFQGGLVKVIDYPVAEPEMIVVSLFKRTVLGFLFGVIIAYAILIMLNMFDTRVTTSNELTERYNYPVLGEIPSLKTHSRKYSYYRRYSYDRGAYRKGGYR